MFPRPRPYGIVRGLPLAAATLLLACETPVVPPEFGCRSDADCKSGRTCDSLSQTCVGAGGAGGSGGGGELPIEERCGAACLRLLECAQEDETLEACISDCVAAAEARPMADCLACIVSSACESILPPSGEPGVCDGACDEVSEPAPPR